MVVALGRSARVRGDDEVVVQVARGERGGRDAHVGRSPGEYQGVDALRAQQGEDIVAIETPLFNVQASFLQAGFDQVQASYGTMANYLTQGLGLSRATIDTLRDKLVV